MPYAPLSRRRLLAWSLFACGLPGCGTILYPERKGQPAGPIDWKIVALDGIGLLFFFVPGVIAFAVDFVTGAIYLPAGECADRVPPPDRRRLLSRSVSRGEMSIPGVERLVSDHLQRPFELAPGAYSTCELARIDDFWTMHEDFLSQSRVS